MLLPATITEGSNFFPALWIVVGNKYNEGSASNEAAKKKVLCVNNKNDT